MQRPQDAAREFSAALDALAAGDARRTPALLRLGDACRDANDRARAQAAYAEVLEREPDHAQAILQSAMLRFGDSDVAEARALMDRHIARAPAAAGPRLRRLAMLPAIVQSDGEIDEVMGRFSQELAELRDARLEPLRDPPSEIGVLPFFLAYYGRECRELLQAFYSVCARCCRVPVEPACRAVARSGRVRVGFVSTFFYAHSVGRTTFGLIADLPRAQFEVRVFSIAPHPDPWAQAFRQHADSYSELPLELEAVRQAIRDAELDVLLFADIGMHPLTYFLAFSRLAPIQLTTWGHPVTSGIDSIGYYLSADALETAGAERRYSEELLRIPGYFMPRYQKAALEAPRKSRAELGLPEDRRLYCCPQSLFKLHPDFDPALKAILEQDAQAEVVLLESSPRWAELLRRRFQRSLGEAARRLRFVPPMAQRDFHQLLAAADVVLDPFHFGGCNSSCEALALGVPVVTLPGEQLAGRFTLALYQELGLGSCIAESADRYVAIALELAKDAEYRRTVSGEILARSERLFQRTDAAHALGEALLQIVG
jgi:predicted O-linked N-acetylglucosamine transferase (SPINDLY family)